MENKNLVKVQKLLNEVTRSIKSFDLKAWIKENDSYKINAEYVICVSLKSNNYIHITYMLDTQHINNMLDMKKEEAMDLWSNYFINDITEELSYNANGGY